jgi:hypothetical protein
MSSNDSLTILFHPFQSACKLMAKQKVALECLSYHATAAQDQTIKLASEPIKSAEDYKLYSFKFIGNLFDEKFSNNFKVCKLFEENLCFNFFPHQQILSLRKRKRAAQR